MYVGLSLVPSVLLVKKLPLWSKACREGAKYFHTVDEESMPNSFLNTPFLLTNFTTSNETSPGPSTFTSVATADLASVVMGYAFNADPCESPAVVLVPKPVIFQYYLDNIDNDC